MKIKQIIKWIFFIPCGYIALSLTSFLVYLGWSAIAAYLGNVSKVAYIIIALMSSPIVLPISAVVFMLGAVLTRLVSPNRIACLVLTVLWSLWIIKSIFTYHLPIVDEPGVTTIQMPTFIYAIFAIYNICVVLVVANSIEKE
jgi:hypothetical protein